MMPVLCETKSSGVVQFVTSADVLWKAGRISRMGEDQSAKPSWTSDPWMKEVNDLESDAIGYMVLPVAGFWPETSE